MAKKPEFRRKEEKHTPAKNSKEGKLNEGKDRPTTLSDRTTLRHKDGQNKDDSTNNKA